MDSGLLTDFIVFIAENFLKTLECLHSIGGSMYFSAGDMHRAWLGGSTTYKIHILGVFDGNMVAFKYFGKHKQRWHYRIEDHGFLELYIGRAREVVDE